MVITTHDKKEFIVDNETGEQIQEVLKSVNPPQFIDLYGDGRDMVATSSISRVHSENDYDQFLRIGNETPKLPAHTKSDYRDRWYKILRLNKERLQKYGAPYKQISTIRSLEELDHYEQTGEWPKYTDPRRRGL